MNRRVALAALLLLAVSWEIKSNWEVLAALAAVAVLAYEIVSPAWRKRKLRRPCRAFFHVREHWHGELGYVVQDDAGHNVKEIVVPAYSEVELETTYTPDVEFVVHRTVFGIDGRESEKPLPLERLTRFIADGKGKNHWIPGVDQTDSLDRNGNYHYDSALPGRAVGTWYTMAFKVKTQTPGVYPAWIGFLTNEVDGNARLTIRVEEKPKTRMVCCLHRGCIVRPRISPPA